ncbi:MAG: spermidine/putrescine ABC transporter permease PotC [Methylococcaceae bacterium]|jgi:spermidine/putrescine transport system permease protein
MVLWIGFGFLYLPLVVLMAYSFNTTDYGVRWDGIGLQWYRNLATDDGLIVAAYNSLTVAVLAASLASVIGTLGAIGLRLYESRASRLVHGLLFVTLMTPDIVMGVSLLVLFSVLSIPLGFCSLVLAHTAFCLPFVTMTVLVRLEAFDRHLMEAAHDLGASEARALWFVVLPLVLPAVAAGWLLSFTLSLDDVVVSFFVTGPDFDVLPLRIYAMVRMGVKPEVNALATLMFAGSLLVITLAHGLLGRSRM